MCYITKSIMSHVWRAGTIGIIVVDLFFLGAGRNTYAQVADTSPPELVNLTFNPTTFDTSTGDQNVVVTWTLTDDLTGVATNTQNWRP